MSKLKRQKRVKMRSSPPSERCRLVAGVMARNRVRKEQESGVGVGPPAPVPTGEGAEGAVRVVATPHGKSKRLLPGRPRRPEPDTSAAAGDSWAKVVGRKEKRVAGRQQTSEPVKAPPSTMAGGKQKKKRKMADDSAPVAPPTGSKPAVGPPRPEVRGKRGSEERRSLSPFEHEVSMEGKGSQPAKSKSRMRQSPRPLSTAAVILTVPEGGSFGTPSRRPNRR